MKQQTIGHSFELVGKGLHTGDIITAVFSPAEPNTGICIQRSDLPGQPTYEAVATLVTQTTRGTVLENGAWKVSTIEHAMSALYALRITNCLIRLNGAEMPILDGSAMPFVEQIQKAGIITQLADAKEWVVTEPITFDNGQGCKMVIRPASHFSVSVKVNYPSCIIGMQGAELNDLSYYVKDIASSRTFCFLREIKPLLQLGLIRGGDLQNALVVYDKKVCQCTMNRLTRRLHQPHVDASRLGYITQPKVVNEAARHKLLDVIGDMALIGERICGRIEVECPGHGFNTDCAKQILTASLKE